MADKHNRRVCSFCMMITFENEEEYRLHKDTVHFAFSKYPCLFTCKEGFPTLERFIIHTVAKHQRYACRYCVQDNWKQKEFDKENSKKQITGIFGSDKEYVKHMLARHDEWACVKCNMQTFGTQDDYNIHCGDFCNEWCLKKPKTFQAYCKYCEHDNKFHNKAEQNLHALQHAFLLFFLEQTICGHGCCVSFRKEVVDRYTEVKDLEKGKKDDTYKEKIGPAIQAVVQAVCKLANHIIEWHNRCLFCENPITEKSRESLNEALNKLTPPQIGYHARMFLRPNKNAFTESEISDYICDMCGLPLQPNRRSHLFFANIAKFPIGKGLGVQDYPFHHIEYDQLGAKNTMTMSVIKEVPANEEETCFMPKNGEKDDIMKEEKNDIISGEEDENGEDDFLDEDSEEEEEEKKEEEDKKEEKAKAEPKEEK
ncbi:MAG: hypothetical protein IJ793_01760 [Opitutales bacterium]|nr:hypothetical protein [Opitutales bacterium]